MSGVEADMIRCSLVPEIQSTVQGTNIEVERQFIGDYGAHANRELETARITLENSLMVLARNCVLTRKIGSLTRDSRFCSSADRKALGLGQPGALMPVDMLISVPCIRKDLKWTIQVGHVTRALQSP